MSLPIAPDDLPAVVAELRENGVAYYAVEGDIEICGSCHGHDIARSGDVNSPCLSCDGGANNVPPSEWVALGQSCGACDCDDCKSRHTLTVGCPTCDGEGFLDRIVDDRSFYPSDGPPDCHSCDGDGIVSVDVVVRDVLGPVQSESPFIVGTVWDRADGTFWLVEDSGDPMEPPIGYPVHPVGPDRAPGMFVAVMEVAS